MLSERVIRSTGARRLAPLVALLAVLVASAVVTPALVRSFDGATTPVRITIAVAMLAPAALLMGMPFAIGMRAANAVPGAPTAFLWGINGATSVCASVLAVALGVFFGISVAFAAGVVAYAVAAVAMTIIERRATPRPGDGRMVDLGEAHDEVRDDHPSLLVTRGASVAVDG
jgi:hypothetical protein